MSPEQQVLNQAMIQVIKLQGDLSKATADSDKERIAQYITEVENSTGASREAIKEALTNIAARFSLTGK